MDSEGWIDVSLIAGFNRVKTLTNDIGIIRDVMGLSNLVELSADREKVRAANGLWEQFILPGAPASRVVVSPSMHARAMPPQQQPHAYYAGGFMYPPPMMMHAPQPYPYPYPPMPYISPVQQQPPSAIETTLDAQPVQGLGVTLDGRTGSGESEPTIAPEAAETGEATTGASAGPAMASPGAIVDSGKSELNSKVDAERDAKGALDG